MKYREKFQTHKLINLSNVEMELYYLFYWRENAEITLFKPTLIPIFIEKFK